MINRKNFLKLLQACHELYIREQVREQFEKAEISKSSKSSKSKASIKTTKNSKNIGNMFANMTEKEFQLDIGKNFNLTGCLFNKLSDRYKEHPDRPAMASYYRPICGRGKDQYYCYLAHLRTWRKTGTTWGYCKECPKFLKMTCMEDNTRYSEECVLGHYRVEAT